MIYSVIQKLWTGKINRWDGLTEDQADAMFETCSKDNRTFAASITERTAH